MPHARRRVLVTVSLPLVVALAAGCLGGKDQPQFTLARRPIIGGTVDQTHTSVVALVMSSGWSGGYEQFCTGTVIAPRAILSAGHCIRESGINPTDMSIFFGTTVGSGGTVIPVTAAYVHPNYRLAANGAPEYDVSVLIMAQDAPVAAMQWQRTTLGNISGQTVELVGYGVTNAAAQTGNGTRRTVDQVVADMDDMYIYYQGNNDGTCQGDSGGPMFLDEGGTQVVVGVTSYGDQSCVQLGANTRVDPFAAFITQYAGTSTSTRPVTVSITAPLNNSTQGTAFNVTATVSSTAGVSGADLLIDGTVTQSLSGSPWTFELLGVPQGSHQLTVRGHGSDGGTGEASITVNVGTVSPVGCSGANPCAAGFDCINGQCVIHSSTGCSDANPCAYGYDCVSGACVEAGTLPAGTVGASCTANAQCQSGICVGGDAPGGYCSQTCGSDHDCPHSAACQDMGGITLCAAPWSALPPTAATTAKEVGGGCQTGGRAAGPAGTAALLMLALALARRRRAT
ncbi:MAG TPA: trypsin-like serine protease [Polyangia bacterium]